jgi:peptidoglycan/xylan/chitin deacetylase (PgdA/CDA1 family)
MDHWLTLVKKMLPDTWISQATYLLYQAGHKPTVNKKLNSPFKKGIVILSADFEMAWAFRYSKTRKDKAIEMGLHERQNVPKLLSLFEKYRIPVTWATVGHLFLESCRKEDGTRAHPEMPRPPYFENRNWKFENGDWYGGDPCSNYKQDPAWYAPDLIDQIIQSTVNHEIGCHTFSHIDCTDENCPPKLLEAELVKCITLAEKKGIKLKSMVFPGGTFGNYSLVKKMGFTAFRKSTEYQVDLPVITRPGLVQLPSSYCLDKPKHDWPAEKCIRVAGTFAKKAAKYKQFAHYWFHPSMNEWYLENVLPGVLAELRKLEDQGLVEILTMEQAAEKFIEISK